jgi:hypothetical protein
MPVHSMNGREDSDGSQQPAAGLFLRDRKFKFKQVVGYDSSYGARSDLLSFATKKKVVDSERPAIIQLASLLSQAGAGPGQGAAESLT